MLYISFCFISARKGHCKVLCRFVLLIAFCCIESLKGGLSEAALVLLMEIIKCIKFTVIKMMLGKLEILVFLLLRVSKVGSFLLLVP